ncbi:MAG: adenine/guanine phosphoribosyltransferase-like PRPP-binding protein [Cellvibrionaceae bacterium]|jgi:adenine/guanine phosphoribosyltransferase-like PRPP-binding protein
MDEKVPLGFVEIANRLKLQSLPDVDVVIGIATGGTVPASLVAYELGKPLLMLYINYRAEDNSPLYDQPKLLEIPPELKPEQHVLLVDDVSVTGKTLEFARSQLKNQQITTLVMKGSADIVLFPEVGSCVKWPWKSA